MSCLPRRDEQFRYSCGAASSGGRVVWVVDYHNMRLVCATVSGRGDASRLRAVPVSLGGLWRVAVGARTGQVLVVASGQVNARDIDGEWNVTERRIGCSGPSSVKSATVALLGYPMVQRTSWTASSRAL